MHIHRRTGLLQHRKHALLVHVEAEAIHALKAHRLIKMLARDSVGISLRATR